MAFLLSLRGMPTMNAFCLPVPGARTARLLAGALSGAMLFLAMPSAGLWPLAYLCLVPALILLPGSGPREALHVGAIFGVLSCTGKVYWIAETLANYGGLPFAMGAFTTALLVLYLSLYAAAFFLAAARLDPSSPGYPLRCAALWVTLEWLQGHLLTGFPWMLLGYTQHRALPILQASRICGVYGVSFLLVAANAGIVGLIVRGRPGWRVAAVPGLLLLAALGYGYYRLGLVPHGPEVRVGIVQGSIRQDVKWQVDFRNGTLDRYEDLTRRLSGAGTEFIVLPETALPFHFNHAENAVHRDRAVGLVREMKVPMLIGSLERTGERTYNRAFLVSARGETVGHQDKVHLVPFGEYLPMEWLFGYLEGLTRESGRFAPGDDHRVLRLPGRGIPFGVFVCYESIFPEIARAYAGQGAEFLVNVTNDAWFGITSAPYQHLAMGVFRAVENGLPLIRAANTGISGAVDASGRILAATPLFEPLSLAIRITASRERTFYTRHGDLLVLLCAVSTAWLLYSAFRDRS